MDKNKAKVYHDKYIKKTSGYTPPQTQHVNTSLGQFEHTPKKSIKIF